MALFIQVKRDKYCVSCHHCVCKLDEVYIERDGKKFHADWIEAFSDMRKDIAILQAEGCKKIKSLLHAKEAMERLPVSIWAFSSNQLDNFPLGMPANDRTLSTAPFLFRWPEENINGSQIWNRKPTVNVNVFQYIGKFDVGFSGAPVCYTGNYKVVGIFTAKDNNYGYVIPIQTLEKLEAEKRVTKPSPTVNMLHYIEKCNFSSIAITKFNTISDKS